MTNVVINELSGNSAILGEKYSFIQRLTSRLENYFRIINISNPLPVEIILLLFILSTLLLLFWVSRRGTYSTGDKLFLTSLAFFLYSFIFYLIYPFLLKHWYLESLSLLVIFIISSFLVKIIGYKKWYLTILILAFISTSFISTLKNETKQTIRFLKERSTDKSNLRNQIEIIDWVYKKTNNQGFKVYNYLPSVYEYPYQYLFWWYGTQKYQYQPAFIGYADNAPEYILDNHLYWQKQKKLNENYLTFLIIEKDDRFSNQQNVWLDQFNKLCILEEKSFPWNISVQVRTNCHSPRS